jgi:hypothetical protein
MRNTAVFFFAVFTILFWPTASYAQQIDFSARDEIMLMAIEQLKEEQQLSGSEISFSSREEVISTAINQLEGNKQALDKPIEELKTSKPQTSKKETPGIGLVNSYLKKITSRLHPYLSAGAAFNDNVNSTRKKRSSLLYATSAGIRGSYTKGVSSFNLNAIMNTTYYERIAAQNTQDLTVDTSFNFGVKRNTLAIANSYFTNYIAADNLGIKTDQQICYWTDALSLSWGKYFNRIGFDIGGIHSQTSYEDDYKTSDTTSDFFTIGQYLIIAKKTRLSLGYYYKRYKYEWTPASDWKTDSFSLELASVFSPKITGAFSVSYDTKNFKEGNDSRTRSFGLGFAYRISNRSNLSLGLNHVVYDEAYGVTDYSTEDAFGLSGMHRLAFNPRLSLSFQSSAAYKDYPKRQGPHNDFTMYSIGLGLNYAFRQWFDLSLSWQHSRKYSNIDTNYNQNGVLFTSTARF